jgi:hypothetical protein
VNGIEGSSLMVVAVSPVFELRNLAGGSPVKDHCSCPVALFIWGIIANFSLFTF